VWRVVIDGFAGVWHVAVAIVVLKVADHRATHGPELLALYTRHGNVFEWA
jgi:hypothetical protein